MKKFMEFITLTDVAICVLAIFIPVLTVIDRIKTRQDDNAQTELTNKISNVTETILVIQSDVRETQEQMDSTLKKVSDVQDEVADLQKRIDQFLKVAANIEKNYKADRRKEAKELFISSIDEIFNRLDRLSIYGYYRIPENRILTQEHFNWAQYETIKLKSNIYVTENKRLYVLVNELEAMFNLYGTHINTYEHEDNGLGGLGDQVDPIRNKFQKVLMEVRGNDDL